VQFDQANTLYRNGKFQEAATLYEQIIKNGYESPELYFNLGNSAFKLNNIPGAILAYERARRLAPHDEDIAYNLRLANLRIVDKIEPIPQLFLLEWWRGFLSFFTADRWAMLAIILFWGMAILGGVVVMSRSFAVRRVAGLVSGLCFVLGALAIVSEFQRDRIEHSDAMAIVTSPSVSVKSAPDAASTDLFVLHEGLKVEIMDGLGEWKKVRLADGKVGWLADKSVEGI